jgi:hypothetical protein
LHCINTPTVRATVQGIDNLSGGVVVVSCFAGLVLVFCVWSFLLCWLVWCLVLSFLACWLLSPFFLCLDGWSAVGAGGCVRAPRTYPIRIAGDLSPRQQTEHRIRNRTIVHSTRQGTTVILPTSCPTIE